MTTPSELFSRPQRGRSLLPKDWPTAPVVWFKQQPLSASTFLVVNFLFGTLGLWLPLLNARLHGASPVCEELLKLLRAGGLYLYAVPFLAATTGPVFSSIVKDSVEHSRGTKALLASAATTVFFVCALLMQIQLLGPRSTLETENFVLQFIVAALAVLTAVYVHAIVQNESSGSAMADMEQAADELQAKAAAAPVNKKDFN